MIPPPVGEKGGYQPPFSLTGNPKMLGLSFEMTGYCSNRFPTGISNIYESAK